MSKTLRNIYLGLVLFLLSGPLVVVSGVSLNAKKRLFFPPDGLSLRWYVELLTENSWLVPVKNSLTIAFTSRLLAPLHPVCWRCLLLCPWAIFCGAIGYFTPGLCLRWVSPRLSCRRSSPLWAFFPSG
jgi:putative spermidine/putrescine transport system permease protein